MFYGKDMVASAFGVAPYLEFNSDFTEVKLISCTDRKNIRLVVGTKIKNFVSLGEWDIC